MNGNENKIQPRRVKCPVCGYAMPIFYDETAHSGGVTVTCKGRNCHAVFQIKIIHGEQIK